MRSKVVTIFGGSGFIGRYVVKRLAELGAVIRVPTRRPERVDLPQAPGCRRPDQHRALEPDRARRGRAAADRQRLRDQPRRHPVRAPRRRLRAAAGAPAGRDRCGRYEAWSPACRPCLGDRRRCALAGRIWPDQGRGRGSAQGELPAGDHPAAQHRVRAGGRLLQPLRPHEPDLAGPAADRRRAHPLPAGLCRRCRRGRRGGADPARGRRPDLRAGWPDDLHLQGAADLPA